MWHANDLSSEFKKNHITLFCGVPDSTINSLITCFIDDKKINTHITANEGSAVAMATGHYWATQKMGCVFMQNSGIGNAINPLISLASKNIYGVSMLLVIGWRGEPGKKDEPQHMEQGKVTLEQLDLLEIPYFILPKNNNDKNRKKIKKLIKKSISKKTPVALIIRKKTIKNYAGTGKENTFTMTREEAIRKIVSVVNKNTILVSTTGKISRELNEARENQKEKKNRDIFIVGSMGHASYISLAIALSSKEEIICIDGDGAALMHLGAIPAIGKSNPENFTHILINNQMHESVGKIKTCAPSFEFSELAKISGYKSSVRVSQLNMLESVLNRALKTDGPNFIELLVAGKSRTNLSRPALSPKRNIENFIKSIHGN